MCGFVLASVCTGIANSINPEVQGKKMLKVIEKSLRKVSGGVWALMLCLPVGACHRCPVGGGVPSD